MAEKVVDFLAPDKNVSKDGFLFESELRNKLKWTRKQWEDSGEHKTRFNKLCNSLNYWKNKLKPAVVDTCVILTIYNIDRDVKLKLFEIVTEIEKLDENIKVQGFADFRNPRYIAIYFKNKEERDYILNNFRMWENNYVVFMSWALEEAVRSSTLRVHWLPMTVDFDIIKQALNKYVQCVEEERIQLKFMSGRNMNSGKVDFKVKLNQGIKVEDIPHLMVISEMEALITIPGRSPLCLNCECMGHISRDCKRRYCVDCRKMQVRNHLCVETVEKPTYAHKVMADVLTVDRDDWKAAVDTDESAIVLDREEISNKISSLEKQVGVSAKQIGFVNADHKRGKRKLSSEDFMNSNASGSDSEEASSWMKSIDKVQSQAETVVPICVQDHDNMDSAVISDNTSESNTGKLESGKLENKKKNNNKNKKGQFEDPSKSVTVGKVEGSQVYGRLTSAERRRIKENKSFDKLINLNANENFMFQD